MKKFLVFALILLFSVSVMGQTARPGRAPRWDRMVSWILNGQETLTYKTITGCEGLTVGSDGTGYDVTFYSATASNYFLWDESNDLLDIVNTSATTTGTDRAFNLSMTQTGASATKILEAMRVIINSEVQTGDWANAIVGRIDYGSAGDASGGMAAPICAELNYPAKTLPGGAYYNLDLEIEAPTSFVHHGNASYPTAWINFAIWGNATAIGSWEDYGHLFRTDGLTDATGNLFFDNTLRVHVEGTNWYVPMSDAEGEYSSAYLIDISNATDATGTTDGSIATDGGVGIAKKLFIGTDLAVDGTANLDNTDIDGTLTVDGTVFDFNATTTLSLDNTNASNGITINTATSAGVVSIGHTTSETTVNDNFNVTGDADVGGTANLDDVDVDLSAELNIDGELVCIGATGDGGTADGDNDLIVKGDFEVDGTADFDGIIDQDVATTAAGGVTAFYAYPYHQTNALTGELIAVRGSARVDAIDSGSGTVMGGKFQAGNMGTGTDLAIVRGVYIEVVNKTPSGATTWDYARGLEVNMDLDQGTSGNVNTITEAEGINVLWNLPTASNYSVVTTGYGIKIRNEAVGGTGQMLDAAIYVDDRSMSGGISGWDYGLDFNGIGANGFGTADIRFQDGTVLIAGYDGTPNGAVTAAKGSLCLDTTNAKLYINTDAGTTWAEITQ